MHNKRFAMGGGGMATEAVNLRIPEEVRAVAGEPNRLRLAMIDLAAQVKDTITLGRGDPDLPTPPHIIQAAERAMREQRTAPTPVVGLPELREAIAGKLQRENGLPVSTENIIVTTGGQEAVFLIMQALLDPGDEILVPDPRYTAYDDAIVNAGGKIVLVPTDHADAFNLRPEAIEAAITPCTKALIIISPSNPTAGIVTEDRARAIAEIAIRHNLIVISDEIYEKFVYDGWRHFSIGSVPGMADRTITLNGFSKSYAMTGWRVGYVAAPKDMIEAMGKVKAVTTGAAASVSQWAALAAITGSDEPINEFRRIYAERRKLLMDGFHEMGMDYSDPRGAFFLWTNSASTGIHATELCYLLLKEGRVLIFPGTAFGEQWSGYLRISVLQPADQLREALERTRRVVEKYRHI